jgi:hypothetical protein
MQLARSTSSLSSRALVESGVAGGPLLVRAPRAAARSGAAAPPAPARAPDTKQH